MACSIDIRTLTTHGTHAKGAYRVTSVIFAPGSSPTTVKRGGCGGVSVGINNSMNSAALTNAIFGVTGGVALNSATPASNFNICFDTTKKLTIIFEYTIDDGVCDVKITSFSVEVNNGCQYLLTPAGQGGGCDNAIEANYGDQVPLDGPNGLTNGVPWANIMARSSTTPGGNDCYIEKLVPIPATYSIPGGGTGNWIDRINMTTGRVSIPAEGQIACGEPCVEIRIQTTPEYTANQAGCDDCDSGPASLFIKPPDSCTGNQFKRVSISSSDDSVLTSIDLLGLTLNVGGTNVSLGTYFDLFRENGGVWETNQMATTQIANDICAAIGVDDCAEGDVTVIAQVLGDFTYVFALDIYLCNSCGVEVIGGALQGDNQTFQTPAFNGPCPSNPGGVAYASNSNC